MQLYRNKRVEIKDQLYRNKRPFHFGELKHKCTLKKSLVRVLHRFISIDFFSRPPPFPLEAGSLKIFGQQVLLRHQDPRDIFQRPLEIQTSISDTYV